MVLAYVTLEFAHHAPDAVFLYGTCGCLWRVARRNHTLTKMGIFIRSEMSLSTLLRDCGGIGIGNLMNPVSNLFTASWQASRSHMRTNTVPARCGIGPAKTMCQGYPANLERGLFSTVVSRSHNGANTVARQFRQITKRLIFNCGSPQPQSCKHCGTAIQVNLIRPICSKASCSHMRTNTVPRHWWHRSS